MTDCFTPALRALVVATLLVATATVMLVAVGRARAAGALAIGASGAYGQAFDFSSAKDARKSAKSALSKCSASGCRVVTTVSSGCGAFAIDYADPYGAHGWGRAEGLARAQNDALRACYTDGARDCVIRTFFCDAKG
jgi:hypothetical protein